MFQRLTLCVLVSTLAATPLLAEPPEPAATDSGRSARVRAADARSATLLTQGLERSATIRALVNALEKRDVIVYLEMQPALARRLAGTLTWVTKTRDHRYVRVSISTELNTDMAISTIGHELQHAMEVANAAEIVNEATLSRFYQLHGISTRARYNGWDTEAARIAGDDVRRELAGPRVTRVAESIQDFDPEHWLVVYRRARGMLPP